jgi:hypothetical protein
MLELIIEIIRKKLQLISKRLTDKFEHVPHEHTWEFLEVHNVYENYRGSGDLPRYTYRVYECTDPKCKQTKRERI